MPPMRPPRHMMEMGFSTEVLYSFLIIVCSLMVYFATKSIEELSPYKGIKYFRKAFLFFALSYFFRTIIKTLLIFFDKSLILDLPIITGTLSAFLFIYFSTIALFYLLYSLIWKKIGDKSKLIYLFHAIAIAAALVSVLSRNILIHIGVNLILLVIVVIVVIISIRKSKKKTHNMHGIYILLSAFFIFNILEVLIPNFLFSFKMLIYLISCGIFLLIVYKVLRKTGPD